MLTGLPSGERAVLELIALRVLCTVTQPHEYTETQALLARCELSCLTALARGVSKNTVHM